MTRILVAFGTRPEAIKMAPVVLELKKQGSTSDDGLRYWAASRPTRSDASVFPIKPDFDLSIMRPDQSLVEMTAMILEKFSRVLEAIRPDRVLVHGDTTTSFACTLASFYAHTPVGHVEAGLRTGDLHAPWPEEFNRRGVDVIARLTVGANTTGGGKPCSAKGHPVKMS